MKQLFVAIVALLPLVPLRTQLSMLKISEIMYAPENGGVEYVEVYNDGQHAVDLAGLFLARLRADTVSRLYCVSQASLVMPPRAYYVLTADAAAVLSSYTVRYPSQVVELAAMPPLTNGSGTVMLCSADTVAIDRFDYNDALHLPLLHSTKGVALERRSMAEPTNVASNWTSASSTSGFATPTYANSQSCELLFLESDFVVSSDVISPDGDGYCDDLTVSYTLADGTLMCNATVFDGRGRMVRRLLRGAALGTNGSMVWDGRDDAGTLCQRANYILLLSLYDTSGQQQTLRRPIAVLY